MKRDLWSCQVDRIQMGGDVERPREHTTAHTQIMDEEVRKGWLGQQASELITFVYNPRLFQFGVRQSLSYIEVSNAVFGY